MKYDELVEALPLWLDAMYGNAPIDKDGCEEFIEAVYAANDLNKPLVVWCKSFFQLTAIVLGWTADNDFLPVYKCAENDDLDTKNIWRQLVIDIEDQGLKEKFAVLAASRSGSSSATFEPVDLQTVIDSNLKRSDEELRDDFDFDYTDVRPYFDKLFPRASRKVNLHGLTHVQAIRQVRKDLLATEEKNSGVGLTARWSKPAAPETEMGAGEFGSFLTLADSIKKKILDLKSETDPTIYIETEILQLSDLNLHGPQLAFMNFIRSSLADLQKFGSIKNAGNIPFGCLLFPKVALVCEQPVSWSVDDKGRASDINDGAIAFGDGFKYFLVNGREVSPSLIRMTHPVTRSDLEKEPDAFFKQILFQKLGLERYLKEGGVPIVSQSANGRLYREEVAEQEPLAVLELIEDGISRFVEVSADGSTVSDAQAWLRTHQTKVLTDSSDQILNSVIDRWKSRVLSTAPVNREELTSAVNALYEFAGLPTPRIVICQSPWQLTMMPAVITKLPGRNLKNLIEIEPKFESRWTSLYSQIEKEFGMPLSKMDENYSDHSIGNFAPVTRGLRPTFFRFESLVKSDLPYLLPENIYQSLLLEQQRFFASILQNVLHTYQFVTLADTRFGDKDCFGDMLSNLSFRWMAKEFYSQRMEPSRIDNQHVSNFISTPFDEQVVAYDLLGKISSDLSPRDVASLDRWLRIVEAAPNYMFFERTCFVCDRPTQLRLDDNLRLHNEDGPAFAFADGAAGFAYHGVGVPANVITHKDDITVEAIKNEQNIEHRTVMMSLYGESRFLLDSGADLIDEDECGTLYRAHLSDDEPLVMVRVKDPTPSKQGTMGTYYLRVPPHMETAKQAVAWTFGFESPCDYAPEIET